jgi:hypothetical protein
MLMSSFLEEEVPPVRPLSVAAIEELGRCFLDQLSPDSLGSPKPLDVAKLSEVILPQFGIHTIPASAEELGNRAGATDPKGDGDVNILVNEEVWDDLVEPPPQCYFARSTVCHEIGHAVLHVPTLRRHMLVADTLNRVQRRRLKAYEDPEWQAWMFAGSILMPSSTLRMMMNEAEMLSLSEVSEVYDVSEPMANSHLRRLKWCQVSA